MVRLIQWDNIIRDLEASRVYQGSELDQIDLPLKKAELFLGYNVKYPSMGFALFALGDYSKKFKVIIISICYQKG